MSNNYHIYFMFLPRLSSHVHNVGLRNFITQNRHEKQKDNWVENMRVNLEVENIQQKINFFFLETIQTETHLLHLVIVGGYWAITLPILQKNIGFIF